MIIFARPLLTRYDIAGNISIYFIYWGDWIYW